MATDFPEVQEPDKASTKVTRIRHMRGQFSGRLDGRTWPPRSPLQVLSEQNNTDGRIEDVINTKEEKGSFF